MGAWTYLSAPNPSCVRNCGRTLHFVSLPSPEVSDTLCTIPGIVSPAIVLCRLLDCVMNEDFYRVFALDRISVESWRPLRKCSSLNEITKSNLVR